MMSETMFSIDRPRAAAAAELRELLLKCVLSDPKTSAEAFAEWEKTVVFDDLDSQSLKLLPLVYLKILENDLEGGRFFLRIKSIYRRTWTENQVLLSHLEELFAVFNKSELPFIVAEETVRLMEIYDDRGVFPLQNFSILVPVSRKRDFCRTFAENLWLSYDDAVERSKFKKNNLFSIDVFWKTEKEFSYFLKNTEKFQFKESSQLILCSEEQIINLCGNEFLVFGNDNIKWKIISASLFNARKISISGLVSGARNQKLSVALTKMLGDLSARLPIEIPVETPNHIVRYEISKKISGVVRNIRLLGRAYQMHAELENRAATVGGFLKFLKKRYDTDSYNVVFKRAMSAGLRILQKK